MNRDRGVDDALLVCDGCHRRIDHCQCRYKPGGKKNVDKKKLSFKERGQAKREEPKPSSATGPKQPPVVMTLPGGVIIKGFAFRITRLDDQGRAVEFELATGNEDSDCVLWASPQFLAKPLPANLLKRVRERIEESIEGPAHVTASREYGMNKLPGEG